MISFFFVCVDLKMPRYDDRYSSNDRYGGARLCVGHLSSRTRERDLEHLFSKYGRYFLFLCFQLYVCKHSSRLNVVSFLWFCFGYASLVQLLIRFVAVFLDQSLNKG